MQMANTSKLIATLTVLGALTTSPALGQPATQESGDRSTDQYLCKDVMREHASNRDVAIAFIHGVFLGKSGNSKFNVVTLQKQSDAFIERCLDNPNEKALDAMARVKS